MAPNDSARTVLDSSRQNPGSPHQASWPYLLPSNSRKTKKDPEAQASARVTPTSQRSCKKQSCQSMPADVKRMVHLLCLGIGRYFKKYRGPSTCTRARDLINRPMNNLGGKQGFYSNRAGRQKQDAYPVRTVEAHFQSRRSGRLILVCRYH